MKELEYLLQDIPDEEKAEALDYYRGYLEDAGDENEERVLREFGSPERIAAIIRSDLSGSLESGGEFTESGYQDARFKEPNFELAQRRELPEASEQQPESGHPRDGKSGGAAQGRREWWRRTLRVVLLIVILCAVSPLFLGIGSGVLGILAGIAGLLVGLIMLVGVLTVTACIGAVALLVVGVGVLLLSPAAGVLVLGGGMLTLGFALFGIALSVLVYGRLVPWCIRALVDCVSRIFHRERKVAR